VLFLELNVILAALKESNQYFLKGCTHHTPYTLSIKTTLVRKSFLYVIENKLFRNDFHSSKMQHPIASGGLCSPDILFQRPTSVFRPPLQKILDPPLSRLSSTKFFSATSLKTSVLRFLHTPLQKSVKKILNFYSPSPPKLRCLLRPCIHTHNYIIYRQF